VAEACCNARNGLPREALKMFVVATIKLSDEELHFVYFCPLLPSLSDRSRGSSVVYALKSGSETALNEAILTVYKQTAHDSRADAARAIRQAALTKTTPCICAVIDSKCTSDVSNDERRP
jgi:hypothetical protein